MHCENSEVGHSTVLRGRCSGALLTQYTGRMCIRSKFCFVPNSTTKTFEDISIAEHWRVWSTVAEAQNRFYLEGAPRDRNVHIVRTNSSVARELHAKLLSVHSTHLAQMGIHPDDVPAPTAVVVGYFLKDATILPYPTSPTTNLPCLGGVSQPEYARRVGKPIADRRLYLANNDWWLEDFTFDCCGTSRWAESSLRQAERNLLEHEGLQRPPWLNRRYHATKIATLRPLCPLGVDGGENDTSCWPPPKYWTRPADR
jgi:hypothetical protein